MARSRPSLEDIIAKVGITLEDLEKEPTNDDELELAKFCYPWKWVAAHLKLSNADIHGIDVDYQNTELKTLGTIKKWRECQAFKATYRKFVEALLRCGKVKDAVEVCELVQCNIMKTKPQCAPAQGNIEEGNVAA